MPDLATGRPLRVRGLPGGAFAWWLIQQKPSVPVTVLLLSDEEAESVAMDLEALGRPAQELFHLPFGGAGHFSEENEVLRWLDLWRWTNRRCQFLCLSASLLALPLEDPSSFNSRVLELRMGLKAKRDRFLAAMESMGFSRTDTVESIGEYAVRGEVLDVWPSGEDQPLRLLWNLDTIEVIRRLDVATQRSFGFVDSVTVVPVKTMPNLVRAVPGGLVTYMPPDCWVVQKGGELIEGLPSSARHLWVDETGPAGMEFSFGPAPAVAGNIEVLKTQLSRWKEEGWKTVVFCNNRGESERLEELLSPGLAPTVFLGALLRGFVDSENRLAVLTNGEIFGRAHRRPRLPKFEGSSLRSFMELKAGDYVVHERYGIGRYKGLEHIRAGRLESEFLRVDYHRGDKLYVPVFDLKQVQKYIGAEGKRPALSRMDTASWERIKARAREDVARLAQELLERAAQRATRLGHSFPGDSHLEEEFAQSFLYSLTPDQARAVEEVKEDMISPRPMNRVVCGDVGYGKTEVAMRSAFKAVLGRKQVAMLAPTTILAEQHLRTFTERFADYPVSIALLSRFQGAEEKKKILRDLHRGVIDIIIGTHRILQPDLVFKNLGLLIIDEEHRFGVKDKERLLALRETIDVLTLTATPIPRTLAQALGGLKSLSTIESPPEGRLPISTYVGAFDEPLVQKAIESELSRGGQVYYVHNRVKTLKARETWLQGLLPDVRIGALHGQMSGPAIEKVMWEFLHRKFDILLSTTIVESGLDIPNVNTLIVEEAEEFGLAQLYQLRGRVGRTRTKAYCYLFYSTGMMSSEAHKRLEAIREFGALGSGFHLALRDLEIRGAGNLLGPEQHGSLNAVGLDTYNQLLAEEIQKKKGQPVKDQAPDGPVFEVAVSAFLPAEYIPAESERINVYKRILACRPNEMASLREELVDRCGPLPPPAENLFRIAEIRALAQKRGVSKVIQVKGGLEVFFDEWSHPDAETVQALLAGAIGKVRFLPGPPQGIHFELEDPGQALELLSAFLKKSGLTNVPIHSKKA